MALVKSCGTCEHCRIGSKMCGTCVNYDNWEAEKMNTVDKELKYNMTMDGMIKYLEEHGFSATKKYNTFEALYHFYIVKDGTSMHRTFKYPAKSKPSERQYIMVSFLDNMIDDFNKEKASKTWKVTDISIDGSDTDGCHVEATIEANLPHSHDFVKLQDELEKKLNQDSVGDEEAREKYQRALNAYYGSLAFLETGRWSKTNPYNTPTPTLPGIRNVIFSAPATIIIWMDNTKTVVKCGEGDVYDPEKGFAMAISKKILGNKGNYYETYKHWLKRVPENEEK